MIESDLTSVFSAKTVAAFEGEFDFGVEALDDAAGEAFFGLEIVEQEFAVGLEGACDLFERIESGACDFGAPSVEEFGRPSRGAVGPEVLESLDEQESFECAQGAALDLAHAAPLGAGPVAAFFEKDPAHFFEQGIESGGGAGACLLAADGVDGLVELFDDVKAVEDVESLRDEIGGAAEVGLPHVRADEADAAAEVFAHDLEEEIEGALGAIIPDPEQAFAVVVDLVNQRPEFISFADMNLVHSESHHAGEIAMLNAEVHNPFDGAVNIGPRDSEASCDLGPGQKPRPLCEKKPEDIGVAVLAAGPGHPFDGGTTSAAVDAAGGVNESHAQSPQRNEAPPAFGLPVVSWALLSASRTHPATAPTFRDFHAQRLGVIRVPSRSAVDKALDRVNLSEYPSKRYVVHNGWFIGARPGSASLILFQKPKAFFQLFPQEEAFGGNVVPPSYCSARQRLFLKPIAFYPQFSSKSLQKQLNCGCFSRIVLPTENSE